MDTIKSLLFAALFCIGQAGNGQTKKPNIVFIYTDDQASWTLGCYNNAQAYTPNIDRLAKEGAKFSNALVTTPVCSPARVSLMTSQYASEYGVLDFIPQPGHKLYKAGDDLGLPLKAITFPEVLAGAGYTNGLVGKWHVGDWDQSVDKKYHPTKHGYHYFMGLTGGGTSPVNPPLEVDGVVKKMEGLTDDILTGYALNFIKDNAKNPFLLSLHLRSPHSAWLPVDDKDRQPYENMDPIIPNPDYPDLDIVKVKKRMKEYLASVSGVDRNVGRIMKALEDMGLSNNTIVIFTSDHGYNMGHNGIEHKGNGDWITKNMPAATKNIAKGSRPNLYDNSLRVPAIVRWPGVIKPGIVIKETISNLDWYPTVVEMAGAKLPEKKIVRGRNMLPLMMGKAQKNWNNDFYAEYSMINYSQAFMRAYRTSEWKLIRDFLDPKRDELYNLVKDPAESTNLIAVKDPKVQKTIIELDAKIKANMKAINDPLLKQLN
jgi:arylsulfatase A-like enzyme